MKRRHLALVPLALVSAAVVLSICACTEGDLLLRKSIEDLAISYEWQDMNMGLTGSVADTWLGYSVGMSTNYAIIGAPRTDSIDRGAAYIYSRSGDSWTASMPVYSSTRTDGDYFGNAVAISDLLAAVTSGGIGEVEIYERNGTTWSWSTNFTGSAGFGGALDVSDDYVIVGDATAGLSWIYHKSGTWSSQLLTGVIADRFGYSVSISGSYAVVGADFHDGTQTNSGIVYVFHRSGTNSWIQTQQISPPTETASGAFGRSVCVRGNSLAIGERGTSKVHFYELSGSQWSYQESCFVTGVLATDEFGTAVAIADGVAATGASGMDSKSGMVYPFEFSSGTWRDSAQTSLSYALRQANDYFGQSVSMNDDFMIVGAPYVENGVAADAGAAFIYRKVKKTGK